MQQSLAYRLARRQGYPPAIAGSLVGGVSGLNCVENTVRIEGIDACILKAAPDGFSLECKLPNALNFRKEFKLGQVLYAFSNQAVKGLPMPVLVGLENNYIKGLQNISRMSW